MFDLHPDDIEELKKIEERVLAEVTIFLDPKRGTMSVNGVEIPTINEEFLAALDNLQIETDEDE